MNTVYVTIVGNVDHGKTALYDLLTASSAISTEAGNITQSVRVKKVNPFEEVDRWSRKYHSTLSAEWKISKGSCIIIDTPGHNYFEDARIRSMKTSDVIFFVVDVTKGWDQTQKKLYQSITSLGKDIILVFNKIDLFNPCYTKEYFENKTIKEIVTDLKEKLEAVNEKLLYDGIYAKFFWEAPSTGIPLIFPVSAREKIGVYQLMYYVMKKYPSAFIEADSYVFDAVYDKNKYYNVVISRGHKLNKSDKYPAFKTRSFKNFQGIEITPSEHDVFLIENQFKDDTKLLQPGFSFKHQRLASKEYIEGVLLKANNNVELEGMYFGLKDVVHTNGSIGPITKKDVINMSNLSPYYKVVLTTDERLIKNNLELLHRNSIKVIADPLIYKLVEKYKEYKINLKCKLIEEFIKKNPIAKNFHIGAVATGGIFSIKDNKILLGVDIKGTISVGSEIILKGYKLKVLGIQKDKVPSTEAKDCRIGLLLSIENEFKGVICEGDLLTVKVNLKTLDSYRKICLEEDIDLLQKMYELNKIYSFYANEV